MSRKFPRLLVGSALLGVLGCYTPEKFDASQDTGPAAETQSGIVYPINGGRQICNPAISADTARFPASMLWLGFSGTLAVKNPPEGYTTTGVRQHDRLTISRHDNTVAWFMLMDEIPSVRCEFQDPDWSAHPDWIVTMGATASNDNCDNADTLWYSGYIIRPIDRAYLRWAYRSLDYISTPHFWIDPAQAPQVASSGIAADSLRLDSAEYVNGFITAEALERYLGTRRVKFTWSKIENGYTIYYLDYSEPNPRPRVLAKPAGRENWKAESAMISPDGRWIAYNLYERQDVYAAYVQELAPGSRPILLAEGAMDPRWFIHPTSPDRVFLVYITVPVGATYILKHDFLDPQVELSGAAGETWMQEVRLAAGLPRDLAYAPVGIPVRLARLPFRGGRSPDGRWLATGTNNGYMLELP